MTDPTRAAVSQPEPDVDDILQLAAIIAKVDGNNSLGAAALAEEILSHPHSRWTTDRAQRHPQPAGQLPPDYIDTEHTGIDRELLQAFYAACRSEGGTVDEVTLRGLRAAIAADRAQRQPEPGEVQELVEWLLEEADDYDCIGETLASHKCRRIAELLSQRHPQPVPESGNDRVPMPTNADQSALMALLGERWLRDNAPERLSQSAPMSPQPVPVSERLPGPEDMTEDGEVWIEDPGHDYPLADAGDYDWEPHKWILRPIGKFDAKNGLRWLPAHALPLPGEVDHG